MVRETLNIIEWGAIIGLVGCCFWVIYWARKEDEVEEVLDYYERVEFPPLTLSRKAITIDDPIETASRVRWEEEL